MTFNQVYYTKFKRIKSKKIPFNKLYAKKNNKILKI